MEKQRMSKFKKFIFIILSQWSTLAFTQSNNLNDTSVSSTSSVQKEESQEVIIKKDKDTLTSSVLTGTDSTISATEGANNTTSSNLTNSDSKSSSIEAQNVNKEGSSIFENTENTPNKEPGKPGEKVTADDSDTSLNVEWNYPSQIKKSKEQTDDTKEGVAIKKTTIFLSGKVPSEGLTIKILDGIIELLDSKEKIKKYPLKQALKSESQKDSDKSGFFSFVVELPEGNYQVPVTVINKETKKRKSFILSLQIKPEEILFNASLSEGGTMLSQLDPRRPYISLGLGLNFFRYSQLRSDTSLDLNFDSIGVPSIFFETQNSFSKKWTGTFSYEYYPIAVRDGSGIKVSPNKSRMAITSLDVGYRPDHWKISLFKRDIIYSLLGGVGFYESPFLTVISPTELGVVTLNETILRGRGSLTYLSSSNRVYEAFLGIGYPLSVEKSTIKSPIIFEGSLGLKQKLFGNISYGLFWHGQYQQFKFSTKKTSVDLVHGDQYFIYSNMDVRFFWTH